ncbi:hypothetical protein [Nocardia aurantia]|uniref:Uncharacterized protein n=1 Tax=Nocardia aurantia TaxID=2585199 RepID=A0A7K0DWE5_9NOCA|nr:hypothetical protein [Nocardia aurantia]MQY30103.1 hypothetical protein [Nocardia aurantia]
MRNLVVFTTVIAGVLVPMGSAAAESVSAPAAARASAVATGSSSEDVFCAVLRFLKGGWAGQPADCSF